MAAPSNLTLPICRSVFGDISPRSGAPTSDDHAALAFRGSKPRCRNSEKKQKKSRKREQGVCLRQTTKPSKVNAHHVWNRELRRSTWLHKARTRHPDRHEALQPLINAILWLITSSADVIFNDTSHQNASAWMDGRLVGG